jgi:hypothetical protein
VHPHSSVRIAGAQSCAHACGSASQLHRLLLQTLRHLAQCKKSLAKSAAKSDYSMQLLCQRRRSSMSCGAHCTEPDSPPRGMLTDVLRFCLHDGPGNSRGVLCAAPGVTTRRHSLLGPKSPFAKRNAGGAACQRVCGITPPDGEGFSREKCQNIAKAAGASRAAPCRSPAAGGRSTR